MFTSLSAGGSMTSACVHRASGVGATQRPLLLLCHRGIANKQNLRNNKEYGSRDVQTDAEENEHERWMSE